MRYVAFTTAGPVDIGEFPDQPTAEAWAGERFGEDLQAVMIQQNDSVTVTADPPVSASMILGGAVVLFALATLSKPRRKKR